MTFLVIPAQAGMILNYYLHHRYQIGYPCTSGDDPVFLTEEEAKNELSLHKRG
jgi:hypothetical protein